jgi:hypothetical protein
MQAKGILLRGGFKAGYMAIQLRLWSPFAHAGVLMEYDTIVEASALKNEVIWHRDRKYPLCWQKVLSFDHLTAEQRERISAQAQQTIGSKYDWQAARGLALGTPEDDPRRLICFEQVGRSCHGVLNFGTKKDHELTAWDLWRAWRKSLPV